MSPTDEYKNKRIAILGYGIEGQSATRFFLSYGADVTVFDESEIEIPENSSAKYFPFAKKFSGEFDIAVRSPGVRPDHPWVLKAKKSGAEITSATRIFFERCPCPIIGVTGTKGKGTTSALIYEMLKTDGRDVYLLGNIGEPALDALDSLVPDSIVVYELSSFQLMDMDRSPQIAVVLMVTSEHLNYHPSVDEYVDAKANIVRHQKKGDMTIVNADYKNSLRIAKETKGRMWLTSNRTQHSHILENVRVLCGDGVLGRLDGVCSVEEGFIVLRGESSEETRIVSTSDVALPGAHNLENACAAVVAGHVAGASISSIRTAITTFTGLAHRLEFVAEKSGVKYYNDSFSTTPETAIAAIRAFDEPKVLILGGSSKGADFSELAKVICESDSIRAIVGVGKEWPKIKKELELKNTRLKHSNILKNVGMFSGEIVEGVKNMEEIVRQASGVARSGDVVLLSPACASFDMFTNYKKRGEEFVDSVRAM